MHATALCTPSPTSSSTITTFTTASSTCVCRSGQIFICISCICRVAALLTSSTSSSTVASSSSTTSVIASTTMRLSFAPLPRFLLSSLCRINDLCISNNESAFITYSFALTCLEDREVLTSSATRMYLICGERMSDRLPGTRRASEHEASIPYYHAGIAQASSRNVPHPIYEAELLAISLHALICSFRSCRPRTRDRLTAEVSYASLRVRFMKLSQAIRCPLKVSPFLSSTSCLNMHGPKLHTSDYQL